MTDFKKLSDEEILSELQSRLSAPQQQGVPWASQDGRKIDPMGAMGSFIRGVRDPIDKGAAIAVRVANALGLAPDSEVARVEGINKAAEQDFQQNWRSGNAPQLDVPRMLGFGAVTGLATAPGKIAPTLLGRMGQAGKAGAVGGAASRIDNAKDNKDFFLRTAGQAGIGGVAGFLGQPIVEGAASGIAKLAAGVVNRGAGAVRGAIGDLSDEAARKIAAESLAKNGVRFDTLNSSVQKSLANEVKEAMKRYGGVNAAALARQADFDELGIDPLKAWVTRDPIDFGRVKNLEATDAGDVLKRKSADLSRTLVDRLEGMRGVNTGDQFQSGSRVGAALSKAHGAAKDRVTALYDQFRNTAPNVSADPKRLGDTIMDSVEKDALGDFLGPLKNLINDFTTGKRPTTPDSLYRAQQVANAVVRRGGPEGMAARKIVDAIDNELEQMGRDMSAVGPEMAQAANLLKKARSAHRELKMAEESIPALKAVAEGNYAAEDFLGKYIVGADVREVAAMWSKVGGKEVKDAARSQLIDALKTAAMNDPTKPFKADSFRKLVSSPGMAQKIEIILGSGGKSLVERINRAATSAISIPAGARYNTSGTAMELMNMSRRLPVIGPLVSEPISGLANEVAANAAQKAGARAFGQGFINPESEEMLRLLRRGSGLLAPMIGGAGGGLLQ